MFSLTYTSCVLTTLLVLCKLSLPTHSLPFDLAHLLDPVQQAEEEGELETKRVVAKSVFNVPVKTEAPIPQCPEGSQRVTASGDCVSKAPSISYGDKFLFDSIRNFYKAKPSPSPSTPHRRRRPTTPRSTTTPRYEEVPTYVFEDDLKSSPSERPPIRPDVGANSEKPGVKYEYSPSNSVTEILMPSPVTEAAEPLSPVTEAAEPLGPVTDAAEPLSPVTEASWPVSPVTEVSEPSTPVTQISIPINSSIEESEPSSLVTSNLSHSTPLTEEFHQNPDPVTQVTNQINPIPKADAGEPVVTLTPAAHTTIDSSSLIDLDLDPNPKEEPFAKQPESEPTEPTTFPASAVEIDVTVVPGPDHSSDITFPDPNPMIDLRPPAPVVHSNPSPFATEPKPEPPNVLPTKDEIVKQTNENDSTGKISDPEPLQKPVQNVPLSPTPEAIISRIEEILKTIQNSEEATTVDAPRTEFFNYDYSTVHEGLQPTTSHSNYG